MPISLVQQLPEYTLYADPPPSYNADQALKDFNALTPEQKSKLAVGIAKAASSDKADEQFKIASADAAQAVANIDKMFVELLAKISAFDEKVLVDNFKTVQKAFHDVVKESVAQAAAMAQRAESFDKSIVKFCADSNVDLEKRKTKVQQFIDDVQSIQKDAQNMKVRFENLKKQFAEFVQSFSTWAKKKEDADTKKIEDLYNEIDELDKKISDIEIAMQVIGYSLGATISTTSVLIAFFADTPAGPWIIGIGLALAGLEIASLAGLAAAKHKLLDDKRHKEGEIRDLQDEISKIKAARTQLEKDGQADLILFNDNVNIIQGVWTTVLSDAAEIKKWLDKGASEAQQPEYMKVSLKEGAKVYSKMSIYLQDYANGTTAKSKAFVI